MLTILLSSVSYFVHIGQFDTYGCADKMRKGWRSALYGLFKPEVEVKYDQGRKYHLFLCAAKNCRLSSGEPGVRRYLDTQDRSSTGNLKKHAIACWGEEAVSLALRGEAATSRSGSIFSAFARQGQHLVTISHRLHSTTETRYVECKLSIPWPSTEISP